MKVQVTGHVVHLGNASTGPIVRSRGSRLVRAVGFLLGGVLILALLLVARITVSLLAAVLSRKPRERPPGLSGDFFGDLLAHLTVKRVSASGQTLVTAVRIRNASGQVFPVRIEGNFISGSLAYGDLITVTLRVIDSVYVVSDGVNHTTCETIRLRA